MTKRLCQPVHSNTKPGASVNARSGPWAFTLVELLVVISIIALLLALLLPSLGAARYTAKKIVSLSNMRQTSLLIFAYAGDNQSLVPNTVRQDQGSNYWSNDFIVDSIPTVIQDTIGNTIHSYTTNSDIFIAPNHLDHLTSTFKAADPTHFAQYYNWYGNPTATIYMYTSYCYLPLLGFQPYFGLIFPKATMRVGDTVEGTSVPFNNLTLLEEVVAGDYYAPPGMDVTFTGDAGPYKSVNFVNGVPDGGNILFGDGSANWVPLAGYTGNIPKYYHWGYQWGTYDVLYRLN